MKRLVPILLLGYLFITQGCQQNQTDHSSLLNPDQEQFVDQLLSKMTLEEKIGQMNQLSMGGPVEEIAEALKKGAIGSLLNVADPSAINQLQKIAVENSRLGIPVLFSRDVIHGFKTMFPIPLGLAATFDPQIVEQGAAIAAQEASSVGLRWTFSPMLDIARDPRWGRIAEGNGEDPYLGSVMGSAMVRGYQAPANGFTHAMAACMKHFAGYGAAEGGRDYNSTYIPERQLRNVYLPPFKAALDAGVMTVMTSFNDNDGVPATANTHLLKDILRDEWGFDGFVVTDWCSSSEMIAHGVARDNKDAARLSANAGVDMDMVSLGFITHLKELIEEGIVSQKTVDDAVRNILSIKVKLGLFDSPFVDTTTAGKSFYAPEHLLAAKQTAIESAVLLKNNGALPLNAHHIKTIMVTGPMADAPYEQMGTWAFDGESEHTITPLAAIRAQYGDTHTILYEPGLTYSREHNKLGIEKAATTARRADAVLVFLGEEAILSGEAHSLADLNLKGDQSALLSAIKSAGKTTVAVVIAGRPLTIEQDLEHCDAMLYSFHPGTMGGEALADLIFGKAVPSGKLPVTFPREVGQIPIYYSHTNTGRPYNGTEILLDDIPLQAGQTSLGNTSFYLDAGFYPLFPFGYGLSYTTFAYTNINLDKTQYSSSDTLYVHFDLTNTGKFDATEVPQLYICDKVASITRPVKELKGFTRVSLEAGQTQTISMSLPISELAFWGLDGKETVEPGQFLLWISPDSATGEPLGFEVR